MRLTPSREAYAGMDHRGQDDGVPSPPPQLPPTLLTDSRPWDILRLLLKNLRVRSSLAADPRPRVWLTVRAGFLHGVGFDFMPLPYWHLLNPPTPFSKGEPELMHQTDTWFCFWLSNQATHSTHLI